ncbi:transposable element Tcb2 transposase [Trichonephila clavipes]|nr:transposable element Tcb2 transposase [Trichonephila clavipes]
MSSRHHIDDFMRGRIIGKIEEGRKITDVAKEFDIAHSVLSRLWKSFKTTGMCSRRQEGGRVRSTTPSEDRYIVLSAKRNRRTTAQQVANQFLAASEKQISRKTVARRLRGGGLYVRRPVVCVPLTRQHRTARLQWCREHHNWTEQDWACVLFSDESRFSLSSDCRRQLIWRESGTAYRPENIRKKDRYPTCSIMVWTGIMINGRTRLHVVANGTMTGQQYIDEVLLPHVRLFRGAVGDKFVFMDDNATCHRTLAVQDCLDSEGIQRLVWPARSQDLNLIENVWDALGRQVVGRHYPPTNKNILIRALTEEWDKLPQQLLDNVVDPNAPSHSGEVHMDNVRGRYERIVWPLYEPIHQKYISISMKPRIRDHYHAHRLSYWLNLIPRLHDSGDGNTSIQHHRLHDHDNPYSYDGVVRHRDNSGSIYPAFTTPFPEEERVQIIEPQPNETSKNVNITVKIETEVVVPVPEKHPVGNLTKPSGEDPSVYSTALIVTIAVGCSLLILNVVIFAGIYYQKEKDSLEKKLQKTYYEEHRSEDDEGHPSGEKPFLVKDLSSSMMLNQYCPPAEFDGSQTLDLVQPSKAKHQFQGPGKGTEACEGQFHLGPRMPQGEREIGIREPLLSSTKSHTITAKVDCLQAWEHPAQEMTVFGIDGRS